MSCTINDLRIKEIEKMFPKIGNLTAEDIDDEMAGFLIKALIQADLREEGYKFTSGRSRFDNSLIGVAWGPKVTDFQIISGYNRWKSIILAKSCIKRKD